MTDIILYISIIVVSGIVGSKVRAYRDRLGWTGTVQTMAIVLLVVLMGARMGANEEIIDNLGTIGLAAFAMTIAMMIGSLLCLFFARKALGFTKDAKSPLCTATRLRKPLWRRKRKSKPKSMASIK